jgi:hypothetical protein
VQIVDGAGGAVALTDPKELKELAGVEQRLLSRFSPPLRPEDVRRCILEATARFDTAVVRSYLMLLIERDAVDRLRRTVADQPLPGTQRANGSGARLDQSMPGASPEADR